MSETRQDEVARCTECWQRADTVELLPDARLDAKGVCGYCRRVGIQSPTPPEHGEVDHAERLWANALHGDRDEWLAEVRALLARVAPQGEKADDGPWFPDAEETATKLMYGETVHVDDVKPMARALLAERDALVADLATLRADAQTMAQALGRIEQWRLRDGACSRCGGYTKPIDGFICAAHLAQDYCYDLALQEDALRTPTPRSGTETTE